MPTAYTTSRRTMHLWSVGAMAESLIYVCFGSLVQLIFNLGFGLDARLVGWALALPRLVDAVLDPILGHWSDTTHTRWGRRRPFLFAGTIAGAVMVVLMWWPSRTWPQMALFGWMLFMSFAVFSFYGIYSMSHAALGYELSDNYNERARVIAIRGFYGSVAGVVCGSLYWLCQLPVFGSEAPGIRAVTGIRYVSVGMALVILACGMVPVIACRERFKRANREHVNLWRALRATMSVRPFVVILILRITHTFGIAIFQLIGFYILVYSVCGGNTKDAAFLSIPSSCVGFAWGIAMMFVAAPVCKAIGKRYGIIVGYGAAALSAAGLPFFAIPGHPWVYLAYGLAFLPLNSFRDTFLSAVMPDICDIDELQSGERREGLFTSVLNFVAKCEASAMSLVTGYLLTSIGFNPKLQVQPPEVVAKLRFWGFSVNIVFTALAFGISCSCRSAPR